MSLSPTGERWARMVSEFEHSGLTVAAFATRRGVNPSTLAWWRSRLRGRARQSAFVPVELPAVVERPAPALLRVALPARGLVVEVPPETDLAWLRSVVEALA